VVRVAGFGVVAEHLPDRHRNAEESIVVTPMTPPSRTLGSHA